MELPTSQHTPTREGRGTVSVHGSLGTGVFSVTPALYCSLTSPRTLAGPPLPVLRMPLGGPQPPPGLLDPTGDFSGPRAPGSFLPVKDVWISYYWFLRQTSYITRLNGFNDRGTPAGKEPDIKNVHHIDGSKPFLEACKQPFLFGFPRLFPSPIWTTLLSSANHLHQPTRSSSKLHRLARSMPRSRVKHFSVDGVEPEERQEQWFSLRIIEDLARMVQYMPKTARQLSLPDGKQALPPSPLQTS